jgi:hypothetical protein
MKLLIMKFSVTLILILISLYYLDDKIYFKEMTNLLQFTINIAKSHRQPQGTSQHVCEVHVLIV